MTVKYNVIEIFTSEEVRWKGRPVWDAIINHVVRTRIAARCLVTRGAAGCYENGEIASGNLEILSFNMPVKIEIILPSSELEKILPGVEEMVGDGIVVVEDMEVRTHRTRRRLIPRQIKVKDAMTPSPKTVSESTCVNEIIKMLLRNPFNSVPVTDSMGRPVGIISQGDLVSRAGMPVRLGLLTQLEQLKVDEHIETIPHKTADEIMTSPAVSVQEDIRLCEAVDIMLKQGLKRLLVINSEEKLTGILSRKDVFRFISKSSPDRKNMRKLNIVEGNIVSVGDIMDRDKHKVFPETPIMEIIGMIANDNIQRVAVVDENEKFLGMIFDFDLVGLFSEHRYGVWDYLIRKLSFRELSQRHAEMIRLTQSMKASDAMKTSLITVMEDTPIQEAILIMNENHIKRLPVVDEKGAFKGIISRDSVLRAGIEHE